jgi:hypothetical protein
MTPIRAGVIALALTALGCGSAGERLREHTYPPSFEYIEQSRLQSAMWELAWEVRRLDHALREPTSDPAAQQQQIAEILSRVETAVDGIATPGRVTQHPLLNRNLPRFRDLVDRARSDAARTPPSYFTATTLVGSCSACHGSAQS